MIISKSPFRVTLGGGGTDFPSYFTEFGPVVSTGFAFNKYCYVSLMHLPNINGVAHQIAYSKFERVKNITSIENNGVRGTLGYLSQKLNNLFDKTGINIINEINPKTGVGSSSTMISALTKCLYEYLNKNITKKELAETVIQIERYFLHESGGYNDQIFTAFGGLVCITYQKDKTFIVRPLAVSTDFQDFLMKSSVLFYTSEENTRNSYQISSSYENKDALNYKHEIARLSWSIKQELENENIEKVGDLIHETWENKKRISGLISNSQIDTTYDKVLNSGALGGRVMGAGSAGFIYAVYPDPEKKRQGVINSGLSYIDVDIDKDGTKIIFQQ